MRPYSHLGPRPLNGRLACAAALFAGLLALAPGPAPAEDGAPESDRLRKLNQALEVSRARESLLTEQARQLEAEVEKVRRSAIEAAFKAQSHGARMSELEEELEALEAERDTISEQLWSRRTQLSALLSGMQKLATQPPEALLVHPNAPVNAVRASLLLRAVVPRVQAEAASLRVELDRLAVLRSEIENQQAKLETVNLALIEESARLEQLLDRKRLLQDETTRERDAERRRLDKLADQARDVRSLIERLELDRKATRDRILKEAERAMAAAERARQEAQGREAAKLEAEAVRKRQEAEQQRREAEQQTQLAARRDDPPPQLREFTGQRGSLIMPTQGKVVRGYGSKDEYGVPSKGIVIETRGSAPVVSPYDGRVVFSGPFRGYGQILLIEHGGGYHTLLAGLGRIDTEVGQWVLAGEPVATMQQEGEEIPNLYVEWRRNREPVNPIPWIAEMNTKVSG